MTGLAWTLLVLKLIIPALSPTGSWLYTGSVQAPATSLRHLGEAVAKPGDLSHTVLVLIAATGLLALGSRLVVALLPNLLSRAISGNPSYWGLGFHYNLLPCVVLAFAMLEVLCRMRRPARPLLLLAVVAVVLAWVGPSQNQFRQHGDPARISAAREAMRIVPAGAPVAADVYLTPQLTKDHPVTQQLRPAPSAAGTIYPDDLGHPIDDEWLVFDRATISQGGPAWVQPAIVHFLGLGYRVVHDSRGFVVLTRP